MLMWWDVHDLSVNMNVVVYNVAIEGGFCLGLYIAR